MGSDACGPPPPNVEKETVLQTATCSVSKCNVLKPQNQVAFSYLMDATRKEKAKTYACP